MSHANPTLTVPLPADLHADLSTVCAIRGESKSAAVGRLLRAAIDAERTDPTFQAAHAAFVERQTASLARVGVRPAPVGPVVPPPAPPVAIGVQGDTVPLEGTAWTAPTFDGAKD